MNAAGATFLFYLQWFNMLSKLTQTEIRYIKQIKQKLLKNIWETYLSVNLFAFIFYFVYAIWILKNGTLDYHLEEYFVKEVDHSLIYSEMIVW